MLRASVSDRGVSKTAAGRNAAHWSPPRAHMSDDYGSPAAFNYDQPSRHAELRWQARAAVSTLMPNVGFRFPPILPKGNAATALPLRGYVGPPSPTYSEEGSASPSRSPTPDGLAELPQLEQSLRSHLSLYPDSVATHSTDLDANDWNVTTTPAHSGPTGPSFRNRPVVPIACSSLDRGASSSSHKRKHCTPNRPGEDEDDEGQGDRNGHPKRRAQRDSHGFSCPYWIRYQPSSVNNSCRGKGFETIPRLKEHLRRVHYNPLLCSRCYTVFNDDQEWSAHERQDPPCTSSTEPSPLAFGPGQFARLQDKMRGIEDVEKWRKIWRILFHETDHNNIPSPHAECLSIHQRHHLINSLEGSVMSSFDDWERLLGQQIQDQTTTAEGDLDISWMIAHLRSHLTGTFRRFRESQTNSSGLEVNPIAAASPTGTYSMTGHASYAQASNSPQNVNSFSTTQESSETINPALMEMQDPSGHSVHPGLGYQFPSSQGSFPTEDENLLHRWYDENNPYQGQYNR